MSTVTASTLRPQDIPFANSIARIYKTDVWTESELVSVVSDVLRMIGTIARRYHDPACSELNVDELESEGRTKFIKRLQGNVLVKFTARTDLFKHLKACINNHLKGQVYRNRFTIKRMGRKIPVKGSDVAYDKSFKPEVSLSDPDVSSRVERQASCRDDRAVSEITNDLAEILTSVEFLVYRQLHEPNQASLIYATVEAFRGRRDRVEVHISTQDMASGLGLDTETFEKLAAQVKEKVKSYMSNTSAELERSHHAAVTALEKVFGLHIPRSLDPLVLRRMLTLSARAQYNKVTPEVVDLLRAVGAKVPQLDQGSGNLKCFGILYQKNNRTCVACSLREACSTEAANVGLGDVVLSPKLMPARALVRTASLTDGAPPLDEPEASPAPVADVADDASAGAAGPRVRVIDSTPTIETGTGPTPMSLDEDRLKTYLYENFKHATFEDQLYFRHKVRRPSGKVRYIFWLGNKDGRLTIRFCKPGKKLAEKLTRVDGSFYPPVGASAELIIDLMGQHADETFNG